MKNENSITELKNLLKKYLYDENEEFKTILKELKLYTDDDLVNERDEAYQEGYQEGYNDGYREGYSEDCYD